MSMMPRIVRCSKSVNIGARRRPMGAAAFTAILAAMVSSSPSSFGVHCFATSSRSFLPRHASSVAGIIGESSINALSRGGDLLESKPSSASLLPSAKIGQYVRRTMALSSTSTDVSDKAAAALSSTADMTPASKLEALRAKMKELNLDVYIIPSDDPHLSGE